MTTAGERDSPLMQCTSTLLPLRCTSSATSTRSGVGGGQVSMRGAAPVPASQHESEYQQAGRGAEGPRPQRRGRD